LSQAFPLVEGSGDYPQLRAFAAGSSGLDPTTVMKFN